MKWYFCDHCNRIFKSEKTYLHVGCPHGSIRYAGNESWWHILYQPELFMDWLKLKGEAWRKRFS